jgi:hypothetical protein
MIKEWISVKKKLPSIADIKADRRLLTYSPCYKREGDKYRLIDAQFVHICTDATHWAYLSSPEEE